MEPLAEACDEANIGRPGDEHGLPNGAPALKGRKVCLVIAGLGAGGAEKVVAWLSRRLAEEGASVTIVSFDGADDPIYHAFPPGVQIRRLSIGTRRKPGSITPPALARIIALRGTLKAVAPYVAISFLTKINTITLAASLGRSTRVIVAERNNPLLQPAHWLWHRTLRLLYGRADAIICQTQASRVCVPSRCQGRVRVIPNPVSAIGSVSAEAGQAKRIGAVGRLEPQKGFDILIAGFARISAEFPGSVLDIWGEGPERDRLSELAARLQVGDRVRLRGLSERPGGWIDETDVFVLSSRFEGFPNVLGEAMAAGLPVIATDCDFGPAELVDDGENGLLVPPENTEAMAAALRRVLGDRGLRSRLMANAPEVARVFSPARVWEDWRKAVEGVL